MNRTKDNLKGSGGANRPWPFLSNRHLSRTMSLRPVGVTVHHNKTKRMNRSLTLLVAASALLWAAQSSNAQDNPTPEHRPRAPRHAGAGPREGGRPHGPPLVAALDVNRDGTLDAAELSNAPAALKRLDANSDGQLSREEFAPRRPGRPGQPPPPPAPDGASDAETPAPGTPGQIPPPLRPAPPFMAALDVDHNSVLDADEIANAAAALLTLDTNQDGQLTPDEYRPSPRHAGPRGGHSEQGQGAQPRGPRGHRPPPPAGDQQP
jgi:hypothetical protein